MLSSSAPTNFTNKPNAASANDISTEVELSISCNQLPNLDLMSKTDQQVFIYMRDGNNWLDVGKTEIIWDNLNPKVGILIFLLYIYHHHQLMNIILSVFSI